MVRAGIVVACLAVATGCGPSGPREVIDHERGCRYVVPAGWAAFGDELRSPRSSLFSIRVFELLEADPTFRKGLPETIVPQLEEWARSYYVVEGAPARAETRVGGLPALELTYAVRVRADESEATRLVYWVIEIATGHRLFVLRAVLPPRALAEDEPAVRVLVESWQFTGSGRASPERPQGAAAAAAAGARASASSVTMPIFRSSPPAVLATSRICTIPS